MTDMRPVGKWLVYSGIFGLLAYSGQLVAPGVSTKFFWLSLVAAGLLLTMGCQLWQQRDAVRVSYTNTDIVFGLLVLVLLLTSLLSPDVVTSLVSDFARLDGWLLYFIGFVYFIGLIVYLRASDWPSFLLVTALAGGLIGLLAFNQRAADADVRVASVVDNAMFLGQLMLLILTFSVYGYLTARTLVFQYLNLGVALIAFVTLMLSGTRGAVVGLVAGAIVIVALNVIRYVRTSSLTVRNIARLSGLMVLGGVVLSVAIFVSGVHERFANVTLQLDTDSRYYLFEAGIDMFLERPMTGWGFEQYDENYQRTFETRYFDKSRISSTEPWHDRAHNTYIDLAIAGGVAALLLLLGWLLMLFVPVLRTVLTPAQTIIFGGIAAWAVSNLFSFPTVTTLIAFMILFALWRKEFAVTQTKLLSRLWGKLTAGTLICVGAGLLLITILHAGDAREVRSAYQEPPASAARVAAFIAASERMTFSSEATFVRTLATDELRRAAGHTIPAAERTALRKQATILSDETNLPLTQKQRSNLIEAYLRLGQATAALALLEDSEMETSTWQPSLLLAIEVLLVNEEYDRANTVAHRVYELEPNNDLAVLAEAATRLREEDEPSAAKLMIEHFGTYHVYDRVYLLALLGRASDDVVYVLDEADKVYPSNVFRNALRLLATPVAERDEVLDSFGIENPREQQLYESILNTPKSYEKGVYQTLHW